MLYREIIAVCSESHTKHINTQCGQSVELLNVKLALHAVVAPDSPMYKKPNGFCGKSVIDSLLRAPWGPFAAPNIKRRAVLRSSGTNSCCSVADSVCVSVVPTVFCALSYGECFCREGFERFECEGGAQTERLAVMLAGIGLGLVCVSVSVSVCVSVCVSVLECVSVYVCVSV